ncbi:MAG: T9SS type A sorting domain-containing protein [Bacteroidetes bacterium]|nr:T9SS type A sorting domain-containing protein [Bacteroidota bacterium]
MKKVISISNLVLKQQLKAYSITAGSIIGLVAVSHATVRYTDLDPDKIITNHLDGFYLDLNNDGTNDFFLLQINSIGATYYGGSYTRYGVYINRFNNNAVHGSATSTYYQFPIPLNSNDVIGTALNWQGGPYFSILAQYSNYGYGASSSGNWFGVKDKYLGLRLEVSGKTYYGWVRLDVKNQGNGFTVKDYAYDDEPDIPIIAGDKGTPSGIDQEKSIDPLIAYSFEKTIYLNDIAHLDRNTEIRVFDMVGREIFHSPLSGITNKINLPDAEPGNYIVKLETPSSIITRKVYIH